MFPKVSVTTICNGGMPGSKVKTFKSFLPSPGQVCVEVSFALSFISQAGVKK
jgi:hypothetical protein